jgi:hypothetical protein
MYQRTTKLTVPSGVMSDVLLRLDSDVAPIARAAPGFIGYFAVAPDETILITTRVFQDRASLDAETQAARAVSNAIASEFGLSDLEVLVDAPIGVARGYGPIEEFTP